MIDLTTVPSSTDTTMASITDTVVNITTASSPTTGTTTPTMATTAATVTPTPTTNVNPKVDLITVNLLNSDVIPDSIAQQFNQIAKLNKSSLCSRRTVKTTSSKLHPLSDIKRQASFEETPHIEPTSTTSSDVDITRLPTSTSTSRKHISDSHKSLQKGLLKDTYHARFHSDDITTLQDYGIRPAQTQASTDAEQMNSGNNELGNNNNNPDGLCDEIPMKNRSSNVFRSKSALSTIPPARREQRFKPGAQSEPSSQGTDSVYRQSPLLASENLLHSQGQSSGLTGSEEGSSSSLPSLDTGGSSSTGGGGCSSGHTQADQEDQPTGEKLNLNSSTVLHSPSKSAKVESDSDKRVSHSPHRPHTDDTKESQAENLSNLAADRTALVLSRRRHTVKELIHVEKEYVSALTTLVNVYMIPLKQEKILDDQQVDTIFFKVQELLMYHMSFLNTLQMWELTNTVGDKLLDMFSREAVTMCYCSFVDNFANSEKTLEACWNTKSSFQKFCEMKLRMNRNKLPLKALLVQPVQRIPRYELLVKRLLESTPKDYSDHALLVEAESAIHRLALRVNAVHAAGEDENIVDGIKLIERLLAPATLTPNRQYVRHDIVSIEERKDPVCLFMFTDQIVFTVARRRGSQVIKKPLFLRLQSIRGVDAIENIKYKIYHRLSIEAIELESHADTGMEPIGQHREVKDKKDLALLAEIENISAKLDYRHYDLDAVVRRMYLSIQKELEDLRTARNAATPMPGNISIFTATSKEGIERYEVMFPNSAKRREWERTVLELKRQLSSVKRTARFNEAIQIPRTLPGIQLSCASVIEASPVMTEGSCDVWICASDGYTGYICLFNAHPKPSIYFNIPLSGCTSRITCICAIPGFMHPGMRRTSYSLGSQSMRSRCTVEKKRSITTDPPILEVEQSALEESSSQSKSSETAKKKADYDTGRKEETHLDTTSRKTQEMTPQEITERKDSISQDISSGSHSTTPPDTPTNTESTLKLSDVDESKTDDDLQASKTSGDLAESKTTDAQKENESKNQTDCPQPNTSESIKPDSQESGNSVVAITYAFDADDPTSNESDSSEISETEAEGGNQQITAENVSDNSSSKETDTNMKSNVENKKKEGYLNCQGKNNYLSRPAQPLMWLGTEEGSIFMFYATDNLKTSRLRQKISLSHAINSILHFDVHIFVACANGHLFVYKRNSDGLWDVDNPVQVKLQPGSNEPVIVKRMLAVAGKIWCAAHRSIFILNPTTLNSELTFPLNGNYADPRGIQLMAYGKQTVWLATENSSRISLYHATSGEFLMEIDLKPVVLERLQDCDEIIMRHKEACLRITCLTVCKDLLWAGTSAGVIVTVAIPKVGTGTTHENVKQPQLETLSHGHIGQVRFLVTLDNIVDDENVSEKECLKIQTTPVNTTTQPLDISNQTTTSSTTSILTTITATTPTTIATTTTTTTASSSTESSTVNPPRTATLSQVGQMSRHHFAASRRASVNPCSTIATKMKVISGGEGREEFIKKDLSSIGGINDMNNNNNAYINIGDDDSDNYVLIWDVQ
uniref:DH domain-containing protein n=1 Tax=Trichobilharzia regenti TaxID=157069 RepID=A0AA85KI67_TRIRE|nr:unnamed protein product [Trichobilharzia regenti]